MPAQGLDIRNRNRDARRRQLFHSVLERVNRSTMPARCYGAGSIMLSIQMFS